MTQCGSLTKANLQIIKNDILKQLEAWAAESGLAIEFKGGTFDSTVATLKLQVSIASDDPNAVPNSPEATNFKHQAPYYGLRTEDLGRTITIQGERFRIVGLKPRASKRPIVLQAVDGGRRVVCGPDYVKLALQRAA